MKPNAPHDRDTLMRLLESLTPGGSEFYESPETCAEWVRRRIEGQHELLVNAYRRIRDLEKMTGG